MVVKITDLHVVEAIKKLEAHFVASPRSMRIGSIPPHSGPLQAEDLEITMRADGTAWRNEPQTFTFFFHVVQVLCVTYFGQMLWIQGDERWVRQALECLSIPTADFDQLRKIREAERDAERFGEVASS